MASPRKCLRHPGIVYEQNTEVCTTNKSTTFKATFKLSNFEFAAFFKLIVCLLQLKTSIVFTCPFICQETEKNPTSLRNSAGAKLSGIHHGGFISLGLPIFSILHCTPFKVMSRSGVRLTCMAIKTWRGIISPAFPRALTVPVLKCFD